MNNAFFKIFRLTAIILLVSNVKSYSQEIKFPESFRGDTSLFRGMKIAEIPEQVQTKYGITTNPGLITNASKTKGILMSGAIPKVKSIYFEIYQDLVEEKMDCGFEVAQFLSRAELEEILPNLDKKNHSAAFLTINNYLIIAYCDGYKNYGERIDKMIDYFEQKLGAKLFQDRKREIVTSVVDDYVTNLPPPLPPAPKGFYTSIALKDLDKHIANTDGLAYMRNKQRKKLAPGKYIATGAYPPFETLSFTLDKDSLLNGDYEYHYAEDYSKSPSKESKLTFDNGVLVSEIIYENGKLLDSTTNAITVVKQGKDYLITRNTITKGPTNGDKEIKIVFRNCKPILKITTKAGVSVVRKDFEKNYLDEFNSKGQLTKLQKPGLTEVYNNGMVTYKEVWIGDNQFIYRDGKLRYQEIRVKGKDQFLVTEFDADGKVRNKRYKGIENSFAIANPDEYESDLTEALFEYYKTKVKQL